MGKLKRNLYLSALIVSIGLNIYLVSSAKTYESGYTRHYNGNTLITRPVKMLHISATPSTGNGALLDISGHGLTTVLNVMAVAQRNTATPGDIPAVSIKSFSTSQVVYNVVQANPATVTVLGLNLLSGNPQAYPANSSDITVRFIIIGY